MSPGGVWGCKPQHPLVPAPEKFERSYTKLCAKNEGNAPVKAYTLCEKLHSHHRILWINVQSTAGDLWKNCKLCKNRIAEKALKTRLLFDMIGTILK